MCATLRAMLRCAPRQRKAADASAAQGRRAAHAGAGAADARRVERTSRGARGCSNAVAKRTAHSTAGAHLVSRVPHVAPVRRRRLVRAPLLLPRAARARRRRLRRRLQSRACEQRQHVGARACLLCAHPARAWSYSVVGRSMLATVTQESMRRLTAPHSPGEQRASAPSSAARASRSTRTRRARRARVPQPARRAASRTRRTLLVVNVKLKVRDVARERPSAARRVALAALDDAHGVELAVAPAAAQARAHLQRRLAGAHLRQNARHGAHQHRVRRCAPRTGRTRSTRPVSTGAAGAAGAASTGSGLPGATTRLPLPEPLPSTAAGTSGDWLPSSAAAAPSASRRARHGKSPGPDNPRAGTGTALRRARRVARRMTPAAATAAPPARGTRRAFGHRLLSFLHLHGRFVRHFAPPRGRRAAAAAQRGWTAALRAVTDALLGQARSSSATSAAARGGAHPARRAPSSTRCTAAVSSRGCR